MSVRSVPHRKGPRPARCPGCKSENVQFGGHVGVKCGWTTIDLCCGACGKRWSSKSEDAIRRFAPRSLSQW